MYLLIKDTSKLHRELCVCMDGIRSDLIFLPQIAAKSETMAAKCYCYRLPLVVRMRMISS